MTIGHIPPRSLFSLFHPAPHQIWGAWGIGIKALCVVIAVALLIVSAKIQVPFWPVPVTMQSAVVLMLPCILGLSAGLTSIALYLGLGVAGYPVFASAAMAGPTYLMGPTGGYLLGFVLMAALVGTLYENIPSSRKTLPLLALMLAGHMGILLLGTLWLAFGVPSMGLTVAIASGFVPFLFGSLAKSILDVFCIQGIRKKHQNF